MKVFSSQNGKMTVALALSLVAIGGLAFIFGGGAEMVSGAESRLPYIETTKATDKLDVSATLNGIVDPWGIPATAWFEWGTDTSYGNSTTPPEYYSGGNGPSNFSKSISGLSANTVYHFKAVARNTNGTNNEGVDFVFTTGNASGGGGPPPGKSGGGTASPLCGFAWGATDENPISKMGVGWVSFNSQDCDTDGDRIFDDGVAGCPTSGTAVPYSVSVKPNGKDLDGFAWSSNLGWIQFGGLSGFPNGGGTQPVNANIQNNNEVRGWARAIAGKDRNDGWDGWISLRGGDAYEVNFDSVTKKFSGFSWGGEVVGWLKWDSTPSKGVRYCDAREQEVIVTLAADPTNGPAPLDVVLTATYTLASEDQKQLAQVINTAEAADARYRFKCDQSDEWSAPQATNTYNCRYILEGRIYTALASVSIDNGAWSDPPARIEIATDQASNLLNASCSVEPSIALVGEQVVWTATISPPDGAMTPYTYTFVFNDGQANPSAINKTDLTPANVSRTYSRIGPKLLQVGVIDSSPVPKTGNCNTSATVVVKPKIIEI